MKKALLSPMLFCAAVFVPELAAVIVDGVAVSAGNKVITRSEIDQRIRLTAFLNGTQPDLSLKEKREAAQRLIDQKLVEREMDLGRYPRLGPDATQSLLAAYIKSSFNGSEAALKASASTYGLTPEEIGADLARQADLLTFLNLRFRPAVQVTEEDIRKNFAEKLAPRLPAEQQQAAFDELRQQIEEQLTVEGADRELDAWLKDQRQRTKIEYEDKDLLESPAETERNAK